MLGTRLKILMGYGLLAIVLISAIWMTFDNTRSLSEVNRASEQLVKRRDVVDSLVYSMLETANSERSILMGNPEEWQHFAESIAFSKHLIERLRPLLDDSTALQRLDTLKSLLDAKYANTLLIRNDIGTDHRDAYYNKKVKELVNGDDSVVIHSQENRRRERQETTYEIVRGRRGFFRKLADLFRHQRSDTLARTHISTNIPGDTIAHDLDISDSVANVLLQIRNAEITAENRRQNVFAQRTQQLKDVSLMLARRTGSLLEDIQKDEHKALSRAVSHAIDTRNRTVSKILSFAVLAIVTAAVMLIYILRDIRRERRDKEQLAKAKNETECIMQQRERLLLTITHDIKAPAASIAGFADLLSENITQPQAAAYAENISSAARHLQQLVSDLLDYHKLADGKAELHYSVFSPANLVVSTVSEMLPLAHERNLSLRARIVNGAEKTCKSDASRIKQILANLVSNALKYTDRGQVEVTMSITEAVLTISVCDTGCGMTANEQQNIFKPFTRMPDAQGKEGTGLGLSITQELLNILGGQISVRSTKGKGSTFTVDIPIQKCDDVGRNPTEEIHHKATAESAERHKKELLKIVVVDDDKLQLKLFTEMLSRIRGIQFEMRVTTHVKEALYMIETDKPQLLFTDIEMPEACGADIMHRVAGQGIKVVAITAHEESIAESLHSEGFDACLFKPFNVQALADTISRLVDTRVYPVKENPLSPILAFADGDTEAEQQILSDLRHSIEEYMTCLSDLNDRQSISKVAHKAMPILEMMYPGQNDWLRPITPEHIGGITREKYQKIAIRLKNVLKALQAHTLSYK